MSTTPSRNLERVPVDRNGALTAALVRIRALAAERRTDRDFAFIFQTAEDTIFQAGAPVGGTTVAADVRRWHEIWTGKYPTDAASDAAAEDRWVLEARIIESQARCLPYVLAKVRMLREHEKGGKWAYEDEMLASIAADIEHLATGRRGMSARRVANTRDPLISLEALERRAYDAFKRAVLKHDRADGRLMRKKIDFRLPAVRRRHGLNTPTSAASQSS